jgi:hypothetical protein
MLLGLENCCNDKEAHGHDEGQNTKCRKQLEGMHFILQMTGRLLHVKFSKKVMVKVRNELHQRIKECILKRD